MVRDAFWDIKCKSSHPKKSCDFFCSKLLIFCSKVGNFLVPNVVTFWFQLWFKNDSLLVHDVEINGFVLPIWWYSSWAPVFLHHFNAFSVGGFRLSRPIFCFFVVNLESASCFLFFLRKMQTLSKKSQSDFTVVTGPSTPGGLAFIRSTPENRDFDLFRS